MQDEVPERDADLIRAAEAAASWARARRASWTTQAPPSRGATAPAVAPPEAASEEEHPDFDVPAPWPEFEAPPVSRGFDAPDAAPEFEHATAPSSYIPAAATESSGVSVADRIGALVRTVPPSVIRGGALGAGVLALGTVVFLGGRSVWRSLPTGTPGGRPAPTTAPETAPKAPPAVEPAAGRAAASARKGAGSVRVTTTPAGARVTVDGKPHGVTPVTVNDLSPGNHEVTLESSAGTVRRTVTVATNQTAQLEESIFSGWLAVYAPFEIVISETNRVLRPDERGQILLPPGLHDLRVSNRTLGYEGTWNVEIKPGATTNLRVTPEPSKLTVTSPEPAEVWVDGTKVGDTPLNAAPVPLGTHDVLVKRAGGAERRYTITVGVKPFTLNAEFR
jgi:PEGA domain-containing protein